MTPDTVLLLVIALAVCAAVALLLRQARRHTALADALARDQDRQRLLLEQTLAAQRSDGDSVRTALQSATADTAERLATLRGEQATAMESVRRVLTQEQAELRLALAQTQEQARTALATQTEATRALLETKLAEIQRGVNEQLHAAVEKQMTESFARVIDQFTAVQRSMAEVQAVTAQIGDLKRLFANVKTRGIWGETQLRAMLDDILPPNAYEANRKIRPDSDEAVEFAVRMPVRGENPPLLPIDAKFPLEDYERLLLASEAGDVDAERQARRALERRIRDEARKINEKYVHPPVTVEFAVLYLPTDGLYAELARIPGLIDEIGRTQRVIVLGPSLFPAMLRTIHLGFVTLALEQKADEIRGLLGATKSEMLRMDAVLERLAKQAGAFSNTIAAARTRARAVGRKLRTVEEIGAQDATRMLELDSPLMEEDPGQEQAADSQIETE